MPAATAAAMNLFIGVSLCLVPGRILDRLRGARCGRPARRALNQSALARSNGNMLQRGNCPTRVPMTEALTERLSRCYTGVVHDVMRGMGLKDFTFPPELRPLMPDKPLAGPVFTIAGKIGDFDAHQTLLEWTGLLSKAKPGQLWLCQ